MPPLPAWNKGVGSNIMKDRSWPEAAIGFAENYANRIAALRAEAAIGQTELSIAASDPQRSFSFFLLCQRHPCNVL